MSFGTPFCIPHRLRLKRISRIRKAFKDVLKDNHVLADRTISETS